MTRIKSYWDSLDYSKAVLNSFFTVVFCALFLEPAVLASLFPRWFIDQIFPVFIFLLIPARVFAMSAILGSLTDIASGATYLVDVQRLRANARQNWLFYAGVQVGFLVLQFGCYLAFPGKDYSLIARFLIPAEVFVLAILICRRKFSWDVKDMLRARPGTPRALGLLVVWALLTVAFVFGKMTLAEHYFLSRGLLFLGYYLYFLFYLLLLETVFKHKKLLYGKPVKGKELILVNPLSGGRIIEVIASIVCRPTPPIFLVLSALTPKDYHIVEFSRVFWRRRYVQPGTLVAISCFTSNAFEAYKIAKQFRAKGSTVVMGGPHVGFMPEEALEFCDAVVVGDAEGVWEKVVQDYEAGTLQRIYSQAPEERHFRRVHEYLMTAPVEKMRNYLETTHGCKFGCEFCCVPALCQGQVRKKTIPEVVELVKRARSRYKILGFMDNNIFSDPAYAQELFRALKPLNIQWSSGASIDIAANEENLRLAKDSGCTMLLIGYEIASDSFEREQGGKFALAEKYVMYTKRLKKAGIGIKGHFMFGFDSDKLIHLLRMWACIFKIFPSWSVLSVVTPFPGTALFDRALAEERIFNLNWRHYTVYTLVLKPKQVSAFWLHLLYPVFFLLFIFTASSMGAGLLGLLSLALMGELFF